MTRRRKFWGWGFENQQPPHDQVEAAAAGAREHLGFPPAEVERPARLEDLELPPARLEPPASLRAICRSDPYERAAHAYGKSYRDVVRAFRGRFDNPPDVVAHPADEGELEQVLAWCEEAGAAAIPFGGGTSVVGGVEPPGDRPAVTIDLKAMAGTTRRSTLISTTSWSRCARSRPVVSGRAAGCRRRAPGRARTAC
jgi:alkyldihydroxyacetonephosphate synthase